MVQTQAALDNSVVAFDAVRDVIDVVGADAATYLQGQISQDVLGLDIGSSRWSFILAPQGKVDGWFRISRIDDDRFVLDLDAGFGEAVLARLVRFKLRTEAVITVATRRWLALRGPLWSDVALEELGGLAVSPSWPGVEGIDVLGPTSEPVLGAGEAVPFGDPTVLAAQRIRAGMPAMGAELDEHTIPAEAGVVEASVSFTKGCYVGQELVARVDSRGNNTPRNLVGVRFEGADLPEPGIDLHGVDAPIGRITSAARTPSGVVALAYVKRGTEPDGSVRVTLPSGESAVGRLVTLPF